jgi:hypothetical protein
MTIPKLVTTVYVVMFTLFILPQDVIAICLPTTVSTFSNELEATVCPGDGEEDLVKFKPSTWATAYRFIVTDENNVIVDWFSGNNFDFEDLGSGIFRVYGLSYSGVLNIPIGQNVLTTDFGSFCWILSDNYVLINSVITVGGIVITQDGDMVAYTCPDGNSNILSFANAFALGNNYAYFITDANGLIFGISEDENFDFEGLPNGTYIVHGVAYVGNLTAEIGDNVNTTNLSDGCYDLSSLTVEVFKDVPEGGTVSLLDGGDFIEICVGDGQPSFVGYTHQNSSNSLYGYLITDENDNILAVQLDSIQDFADAGMGVCHIYGVAYTGNFTTTDGENIFTADITDDCFSISTNFITVQRNQVDGGNVTTSTGENLIYLCPNDNNSSGNGMTDIVEFERTDASNSPYAYLIVDENNIVLAIETGDAYDFENASLGECFVIGVAYTGNITIQSGDDASVVVFSDDCYSFSDNLITVKRINPEGGILQFTGVDSTSTLCAGDVNPDIISIANVDAAIGPYIFIITDENDVIVGNTPAFNIDFDIFSEAACRIYGVSFTGNYQGMLGDTLPNIALSTDCFDISDNFLTVEKNYVNAGNLTTINAETSVIICPNDGVPNVIEFATDTDAQISNYQYIITNNQGEILALPAGNSFDFEPAGIGICKVYAISYTGNLVAEIDSSITTVMSTECYDLSDNFIEVLRDEPNRNIIASDLGDVVDFCVNDGEADVINFLTGSLRLMPISLLTKIML